jgi:hypothetical protein
LKRERLFARIPPSSVGSYGVAAQDIARIQVVRELIQEVIDCLRSDDETDITFGLYFAEHLRPRSDFIALAEASLPMMASLIRTSVIHPSPQVRGHAVRAFVAFRECYEDYSVVMRGLLGSSDAQLRRAALIAAPSFLSSKELEILLPFRDDPEFGETGGMGGPLRYDLRDLALEIAERIAGRKFDNGDCLERRENTEIFWRSWSAFTQWLEGKKRWRFFSN